MRKLFLYFPIYSHDLEKIGWDYYLELLKLDKDISYFYYRICLFCELDFISFKCMINNNIYYSYFDGNDKNISRAKYNEINLKQFNNCVNAHMFTEFIATGYGDTSVWGEKTTAENKQSLLDAYNSFSYEKY